MRMIADYGAHSLPDVTKLTERSISDWRIPKKKMPRIEESHAPGQLNPCESNEIRGVDAFLSSHGFDALFKHVNSDIGL
ncbi:MAG TPA: hypothetical protein VM715_15150, partial [Candidatus Acidoferrum sp.]|nr:hypothetical protein [Candidatus Acidoferrum sp.]